MKKLLTLLLLLCLVMTMTTPVSAGYWLFKDVSADDFTNALVAYCNHNEVHNMTESEFELSRHDFRSYNVVRTNRTLDFDYECKGGYVVFSLLPIPYAYYFVGHMHVDNPERGLGNLYGLTVSKDDRKFTACGLNWILSGNDYYPCDDNYQTTRFYVNDDEPNRLFILMINPDYRPS